MIRTQVSVVAGPNKSAALDLSSEHFSIGAGPDNEIVLDDRAIMLKHLVIERNDDLSFSIIDAHGAFGVTAVPDYANESRYYLPATLRIGYTEIEIANITDESDAILLPEPAISAEPEPDTPPVVEKSTSLLNRNRFLDFNLDALDTNQFVSTASDFISRTSFETWMKRAGVFCAIAAVVFALLSYLSGLSFDRAPPAAEPAPFETAGIAAPAINTDAQDAADIFKMELQERGLDLVGVEPSGIEMVVWGILPDAKRDDWRAAIEWYEARYGLTYPLRSDVEFASESSLIRAISIVSHADPVAIYTKSRKLVRPGDILADGWRLQSIGEEDIVVEKDGRSLTLSLK